MSPTAIDRLDYSKPPRLYLERASDPQVEAGLYAAPTYETCYVGMTRGDSLLAAWAHYKASNDPPGMCIEEVAGADVAWRWVVVADRERRFLAGTQMSARAAAWAWYDRRLQLANLGSPWPFVLTWSNDECADEARRYWEVSRG